MHPPAPSLGPILTHSYLFVLLPLVAFVLLSCGLLATPSSAAERVALHELDINLQADIEAPLRAGLAEPPEATVAVWVCGVSRVRPTRQSRASAPTAPYIASD